MNGQYTHLGSYVSDDDEITQLQYSRGEAAEALLGGEMTEPLLEESIVDRLIDEDALCTPDRKLMKQEKMYKRAVKSLPRTVKKLIELARQFKEVPLSQKGCVQGEMVHVLNKFTHTYNKGEDRLYNLLKQALTRYVVRAQAEGVNPVDPGLVDDGFMKKLHSEVCSHLGVEDKSLVKWYSALGTPLDNLYGADGFFVVDGSVFNEDRPRLLYIDLTRHLPKVQGSRQFLQSMDSPIFRKGSLLLHVNADLNNAVTTGEMRHSFASRITTALGEGAGTKDRDLISGFSLESL
ncbi:hypothetical protein HOG17_01415 [Candidatus Peregrinibacteria bacterium]|jgi:hypothetical protein|nr:hypothetical protein [Candidatus Peregrinibacteria bacterium]MBT4148391.1 hypothetical protein [Candidatus Peregrinibacteria bacterium]MBT4365877.1 hypothetical protein [Candidatus Peregrinibacteria bacterium]MBT4456508.1 hypothetical protein [Candidatus Peregrinibacteria bacterium]